jgi:hypothetical protein
MESEIIGNQTHRSARFKITHTHTHTLILETRILGKLEPKREVITEEQTT